MVKTLKYYWLIDLLMTGIGVDWSNPVGVELIGVWIILTVSADELFDYIQAKRYRRGTV